MESAHSEDVHFIFFISYLAVNKLLTDKTQNIFYLIAEHSGFIKIYLKYLN